MTTKPRSRSATPVAANALQPVAKRLAKIEALLVEMRHEQDVKLKRLQVMQRELSELTDLVTANRTALGRLQRPHRRESAQRSTSSRPRPIGVVDARRSLEAGSAVPPRRRDKPRSEFRGLRAPADYPRSL